MTHFTAAIALFLLLTIGFHSDEVSRAQSANVVVSSVTRWDIPRSVCDGAERCRALARLSTDQSKLYLFTATNRHLFIYDESETSEYDLSAYFESIPIDFDFIPYGNDEIVFYDPASLNIYRYNLNTRQGFEVAPDYSFRHCLSTSNPPQRSFMHFASSDLLLTCGYGSSSSQPPSPSEDQIIYNISTVNLATGEIREIGALSGPAGFVNPWYRVTAGQDDYAYLQPIATTFTESLIPNFNTQSQTTVFILRHGLQSTNWEVIDIPISNLQAWGISGLGELVTIDSASNMYFYSYWYDTSIQSTRAQYTKVNPSGNIEWGFDNSTIMSTPLMMDVMPNGDLLMLHYFPTEETIFQIEQYTISNR